MASTPTAAPATAAKPLPAEPYGFLFDMVRPASISLYFLCVYAMNEERRDRDGVVARASRRRAPSLRRPSRRPADSPYTGSHTTAFAL
jgi:hypothetical protein